MDDAASSTEAASIAYLNSGQDDRVYEFVDGQRILVSSKQHELDYAQLEVSISLMAVREAFVISSFHYWEKWARSLTNSNGRNDSFRVVKERIERLYPIHEKLDQLNHLTSLLKHGSGAFRHARLLARERPDLFLRPPGLYGGWSLSLSGSNVDEAFKIVKRSGPQHEGS